MGEKKTWKSNRSNGLIANSEAESDSRVKHRLSVRTVSWYTHQLRTRKKKKNIKFLSPQIVTDALYDLFA